MKLESKLKAVIIDRGFDSLVHFSKEKNVSYYLLRRLAFNRAKTLDITFLLELCDKLDCEIGDLLVLKK